MFLLYRSNLPINWTPTSPFPPNLCILHWHVVILKLWISHCLVNSVHPQALLLTLQNLNYAMFKVQYFSTPLSSTLLSYHPRGVYLKQSFDWQSPRLNYLKTYFTHTLLQQTETQNLKYSSTLAFSFDGHWGMNGPTNTCYNSVKCTKSMHKNQLNTLLHRCTQVHTYTWRCCQKRGFDFCCNTVKCVHVSNFNIWDCNSGGTTGTHHVSVYERVWGLIIALKGNFNIAHWCKGQQKPSCQNKLGMHVSSWNEKRPFFEFDNNTHSFHFCFLHPHSTARTLESLTSSLLAWFILRGVIILYCTSILKSPALLMQQRHVNSR